MYISSDAWITWDRSSQASRRACAGVLDVGPTIVEKEKTPHMDDNDDDDDDHDHDEVLTPQTPQLLIPRPPTPQPHQ